ncbi:hypothetical protein [Sphingobium sp. EM0848]|uniref:hypothetical protein n=1 Tax=Sphingobium sp. EM0848 TaxID=2743473 RepID=UPI00159C1061|nr:hypothetical protein [Sphingobium sp. EM0848]
MQTALEDGALLNLNNLLIKRLGKPEDIANLAMFPASGALNGITGQLVPVGSGACMP